MKTQLSDNDFYERKINRLESDIATLHQELNLAKGRLRSAEDYQIKYELLLRQSNHENIRLKKIQQIERQKFNKLLVEELNKAEKIWTTRMQYFQQSVIEQEADEKERLKNQILVLKRKVQQMTVKTDEMDSLLFRNKKIARDLQSLQEIIQQNKLINERNKEEQLKACREIVSRKYQQKAQKQREYYEQKFETMQAEIENLSAQLVSQAIKTERMMKKQQLNDKNMINSIVPEEIEKLNEIIGHKNNEIQEILRNKVEFQEHILSQKKQLNGFIRQLEEKIFSIEKAQEIQLFNLKSRMQKTQQQHMQQLVKKNQIVVKQKLKESEKQIKYLNEEVEDLKEQNDRLEKDLSKYAKDKDKLAQKIVQLKARLRQFEHDKQIGETQLLISSFKNTQGKEDQSNNYESGVNFLEKQLRKAAIKIDKKNDEVKELITDITRIRNQCEQEVSELKDKYYNDMEQAEKKIKKLQDQVKSLNQQVRKREKEKKQVQTDFTKTISQLRVELRGLRNLNSDLQRDYNRILESKKVIEKSFREERERSVTSKSQIANTKKQKWLQLQRQKNEIEIIYKEKQQQIKTQLNIIIDELRVERDNLKKQNQLLKSQLAQRPVKLNDEENKENTYSEYHKKLATINLEIALTQNLYNTLIQAKSRKRINTEQKPISQIDERPLDESVHSSAKFIGSEQLFDDLIKGEQSDDVEDLKKQLDRRPQNRVDGDNFGGQTPSFNANLLQSFNPRFQQQ